MQETQETQVQSLSPEDPWRRKWQLTPVFLPGKSHGQGILTVGYSPRGCKESNKTEHTHTYTWFNMTVGSSKSLFVSKSLLEWISLYLWRFHILSLVAQASSKDEQFPLNISKVYKFPSFYILSIINSTIQICACCYVSYMPLLLSLGFYCNLLGSLKYQPLDFTPRISDSTEFGCDPSMRILKRAQVVLACAQGWQLLIQVKPLFQRWSLCLES